MRVTLAGTRSFGRAALEMLHHRDDVDVALVIAPPGDRLANRATSLGYPVAEHAHPERVAGHDLLIAAHSHAFIGKRTRAELKLGAIGYHPSLLPRHRGRDAVDWTIRMADPIAGGTVYWLSDNVDGGPVAAQDWCFVAPGWKASDLWREELFPMGLRLIDRVVSDLCGGIVVSVPQDERCATWEPSLDSAPMFRPELPELGGADGPPGYTHVVRTDGRGALAPGR